MSRHPEHILLHIFTHISSGMCAVEASGPMDGPLCSPTIPRENKILEVNIHGIHTSRCVLGLRCGELQCFFLHPLRELCNYSPDHFVIPHLLNIFLRQAPPRPRHGSLCLVWRYCRRLLFLWLPRLTLLRLPILLLAELAPPS
ncbi:hypothetical protein KC19_VG082900 [Ceratodon purpureus]|uniref:Uncharacterized protein n=1 Tax=Ceratodon purpureus TaxID=3225 RepID=A0A8T0HN91_CERPU|nr:hypothetical protein KC19_VG082900 [Ceratodon purpureus]